MKRKQIVRAAAAALCVTLIASCILEEELTMPNPGFGIISTGQDRNGLDYFIIFARTTGQLARTPVTGQVIIPSGATGNVGQFDVTTNSRSRAVVPGGVAPAFWSVQAGTGWTFSTPGGSSAARGS